MLKLEGNVNGRRVSRLCESADEAVTEAAMLLDTCVINELRLMQILKSLHAAASDGLTWGWSSPNFALSLHPL